MITAKDIIRQRQDLLEILKNESVSIHDYRRLICARSIFNSKGVPRITATQLAALLMLSPHSVRNIQTTYRKKGLKAITGIGGRGGRHRENLSIAREQTLLRRSCSLDELYGRPAISVKLLRTNYRKAAKTYPLNSTLYRLLRRHGCRRISVGLYSPPTP